MTIGRAGVLAAVAVLLVACGEGTGQQDSSPTELDQGAGATPAAPTTSASGDASGVGGASLPTCPCGTLRNPLRATVMSVADEFVRLRVDELPGGSANVDVGSEIEGGLWYGGLPCYYGRVVVAAGDEVLAFYWPAAGAAPQARIALTQWGETVLLADATRDLTMSIEDLSLLDAPNAECHAGLGNIADYIGPADDTLP